MPPAPRQAASIQIDPRNGTPKYRQIIDSVCQAIRTGRLKKGDPLPSINELSAAHHMARETVVKAYNQLKAMGLLDVAHGKGFSVATDHYTGVLRVFVLFDALTPYKETVYEAMRAEAGGRAELDIYFHHFNPALLARLLDDARGKYACYVVMPFLDPEVYRALATLEQDKLLLLDINVDFPGKGCATLWQSHDAQLSATLETAAEDLRRYERLVLVFPEDKHHPQVIKPAFERFCQRHGLEHRIVSTLRGAPVEPSTAYFVIEDTDLVELIKAGHRQHYKLGRDYGILSYNDTPIKEVVQQGIAVVSIDFAELGRKAVRQILGGSAGADEQVPTRYIARPSL